MKRIIIVVAVFAAAALVLNRRAVIRALTTATGTWTGRSSS